MGSQYYENFRATKFNNPPCLYKVISTSFSNEAITLNTFPVLVFKQTETSHEWEGLPCPSVVRITVPLCKAAPSHILSGKPLLLAHHPRCPPRASQLWRHCHP